MARPPAGVLAPRISAPDLPRGLDDVRTLTAGDDVLQARVTGLRGAVDAARLTLTESVLADVDADRFDLTLARLADVDIDAPRATELIASRGSWRNVRITGGRIGALDLGRADLHSVELRGVRIDYLALGEADVSDLLVADCTIGTLDLPRATLARVRFERTRADEVDTRELRASHLDLRGLDAVTYTSPAGLRGATLAPRQVELLAADLAAAFGIDVRD
ncbi:pentapeptide repeat-containing protein [Microbacterium candidum]|uniref:Pentapeptide repeat-containing protein n=1 Tax=Microbacterium candidum TaxID=3041922 RepID=A0ABT7MYR6_9MICO|nr:pentapeptide repeat-containing protein [Microbacterium sp. ASV49]MDL9979594.1 pentapeptide repeat-containing protein [Microbacterium sp. ASV49]